jgi:hypothetical protein
MSTEKLLEIVKARGLRIVLKDDRPVLEKAAGKPEVTSRLLSVLAFHRERIIEKLKKEKA